MLVGVDLHQEQSKYSSANQARSDLILLLSLHQTVTGAGRCPTADTAAPGIPARGAGCRLEQGGKAVLGSHTKSRGQMPAILPLVVIRALQKTACVQLLAIIHSSASIPLLLHLPQDVSPPRPFQLLFAFTCPMGSPRVSKPIPVLLFHLCAFPCDPCIHAAAGCPCRGSLVVQCGTDLVWVCLV